MRLTINRRGSFRGYSDSCYFIDVWIPTIFFAGSAISRSNSLDDTIEIITPVLLRDAAVLVLDLLASLEALQCLMPVMLSPG